MSFRPKISVLIPTYQYGRFLPEAIESVLVQDYADFEILISDDASRDDSAEVIRAYAARDPRIRFQLQAKNLGMVSNWNWCLAEARGDYVKYLFGDDRLTSPTTLGRMVSMLENEPRAVLAATARVILDADSQQTEVWDEAGAPGFHAGPDILYRCIRRDRNVVGEPSAVMFRRAAAGRGFDPSFRQLVDEEMWFHLLGDGGMVYASEPLCAFRQHEAQQTVANRKQQVASAEMMRIAARYFEELAACEGVKPGSFKMRRRIARHIYYSRKDCPPSPLIAAAEADLMAKLGRRWYFIFWLLHRATKPIENLCRSFRRQR